MKLVHPPKLLAVSFLVIVMAMIPFLSDHPGPQPAATQPVFLRGHAAMARVKSLAQVSLSPTQAITATVPVPTLPPTPEIQPTPARHEPAVASSPAFQEFISNVKDGQAKVPRGVYVDGILALKIIQQPDKNWEYVDTDLDVVTQFQSATANGILGFLAHNFLAGQQFYDLKPGQEVGVVYGDGSYKFYKIAGSYSYEKVDSSSLTSDLIEVKSGRLYTTQEIFNQFYGGKDHVTFQTCLEKDGNWSWGLYFVVAEPES